MRSYNQQAGILTKALGWNMHKHILGKLGIFNLYDPDLRGSVKSNSVDYVRPKPIRESDCIMF